nr:energy transducer TonB [Chelatococcus sp. YT9]
MPLGASRWEEGAPRQVARWGLAALLVVTAHAAGAWSVMNWPQDPGPTDPTGAAVLIELAPLPVSPEAPPETEVGPLMVEAEPEPEKPIEPPVETPEPEPPLPPEPAPPAPEPPPPEPEPEPLPPKPEPPRPMVEAPDVDVPELPDVPNAAAVLTPPAPPLPPKEVKKEVKKIEKKEPPRVRRLERRREVERKDKRSDRNSAPPTSDAPRAQTAAAPSQGVTQAPSRASANWKGFVSAHLRRYSRFPGAAQARGQQGNPVVAFTIDRSGRVLSARVARSSGAALLDQEAVAIVRRASPVPAPPADIGGATIPLAIPIRFDIK